MSTCRSTKPTGAGSSWSCSRPSGHKGEHQAKNLDGVIVARWRSKATRKTEDLTTAKAADLVLELLKLAAEELPELEGADVYSILDNMTGKARTAARQSGTSLFLYVDVPGRSSILSLHVAEVPR